MFVAQNEHVTSRNCGKGHFYNVIHFCCGFALMTDETIDLMRLSLNLKVTKTLSSTMN